jgi:hypothetical protein
MSDFDSMPKIPRANMEAARERALDFIDKAIHQSFTKPEADVLAVCLRDVVRSIPINERLIPSGVLVYYVCCEDAVRTKMRCFDTVAHVVLNPLAGELAKLEGVQAEFDKANQWVELQKNVRRP